LDAGSEPPSKKASSPTPGGSKPPKAPPAAAGGGRQQRPSQPFKVYLGHLEPGVTTEQLYRHFSTVGLVTDAVVMKDKLTGRSRCFGFVT
jgi:RNA recognition motif-containing protein